MKFQDFLGIDLPIIQAPMAGVQDSALAIAVSKAGGLGSLPCAVLSPEVLKTELDRIKEKVSAPINLNFFCHLSPEYNHASELKWRAALKPYFLEYGIEECDMTEGAKRSPFSHDIADVIEVYQPEFISFHFGLPNQDLLARVKSWGAKVLSTATTVDEAKWLEANGADAIIAQGVEAGGHRGMFLTQDVSTQLGTFALLPQIIQQVELPVIAAGGIVDAQTVTLALSFGAMAAQVGTAYLLCDEAKTTALHRAAIKSHHAKHTALTTLFSGRPARGIVNRIITEMGAMNTVVPPFPLAATSITALRKKAEAVGIADFSPLWCGQNATGCKEISALALTQQLARLI
ncbi:NAD(P)H-dependent flavin oxidoreductase [Shewanella surugensis]|uniref:Propionate 3-nitronate monooxygenase n=1 Tax=Shewanella surugensis TaxID=212020 RepID=A0ABT0LDC8_9GAMM|nr:nitronate monooxygenase [Shewanella surugensis]MCL1125337.1 nitronate monooxygenase [Shewanella surugensis]